MREAVEESPPLDQLLFRHPEHALDVGDVADAYLDMGLRAETGALIYRLAFHEDPSYGIDRLFCGILPEFVQLDKYRAIKRTAKIMFIQQIPGRSVPCFFIA